MTRRDAALLFVLVAVGCGFVALEPWHGPTVLAFSEQHGVDVADLPAVPVLVLALVFARSRAPVRVSASATTWVGASCAVALGALLVAGLMDPRVGSPLVPAAGGTVGGRVEQADGRRPLAVGRWTHLAMTYDGSRIRLFVDGAEVSDRPASGRILRTRDPLWLGGDHPYGEHFAGVVDDVRVSGRAADAAAVRRAMRTPLTRAGASGLALAYPFDRPGAHIDDVSGNRNDGIPQGARWTSAGRFGGGLEFDGANDLVRVAAARTLDFTGAVTMMAWVRPRTRQPGWRTILARQTDVSYLSAGGGRENVLRLERRDRVRFAVLILLATALGVAFVGGSRLGTLGDSGWVPLLILFLAGSLLDVALSSEDTLIGPALVALGWSGVARRVDERRTMFALGGAFMVVTFVALAAPGTITLPRDAAGVARAAAVGLVMACAGVFTWRGSRSARLRAPAPFFRRGGR